MSSSLVRRRAIAVGRIILFIGVFALASGALQWAVIAAHLIVPREGWSAAQLFVADGTGFIALLIAAAVIARLSGRPQREYGFPLRPSALPLLGEGFVWGVLAVSLVVLLVVVGGGMRIDGLALRGTELLQSAMFWLATMIVLGLFEESLFRGVPQVELADAFGFWPTAVVLSIAFGLLHFFTKPMETWGDATSVALLGFFMAASFRWTGSLWFAAGFHAAFDWAALAVYGAPNTGNGGEPVPGHLLDTHFMGSAWLTGGPRGLEASVMSFVMLAALFACAMWRWRVFAPERTERPELSPRTPVPDSVPLN